MIVRGASVSNESRTLAYEVAERAALPGHLSELLPSVNPHRDATPSIPAVAPLHERLSFEAVAAWLAVQDGETRLACASLLADEIAQTYENAKNEGFSEGYGEGAKTAKSETQLKLQLLSKVANDAEKAFSQEREQLAQQCADIVAEAFAKIAGRLLPVREAALGAVIEVLARAKDSREVLIRVSPSDRAVLDEYREQLATAASGRKFSLVADPQVELGGCIVESKLGNLDGRFEVQVRELFETLRGAKAKGSEAA
jgi:flagellar biosynthesis/type III secretory pathway protein FliH